MITNHKEQSLSTKGLIGKPDNDIKELNELQESLEDSANNLFNNLINENNGTTKFLLLHYITGTEENPYILRRTAIRADVTILGSIINGNDINIKNREALARFIRYFSRQNTFLKLIIERYRKKSKTNNLFTNPMSGKVRISNRQNTLFKEINRRKPNGDYLEWIFSSKVQEIIKPQNIEYDVFFNMLYNNEAQWKLFDKKVWKEIFDYSLYKLFSKITELDIVKINKKIKKEYSINSLNLIYNEYYSLCAGLLSGLLYFLLFLKQDSFSFHIIPKYSKEEKYLRMVVALISPAIDKEPFPKDYINFIFNKLEGKEDSSPLAEKYIDDEINTLCSKDIFKKFKNELHNDVFKTERFKNLSTYNLLLRWLLLISAKAKGSIHEGKNLEFYFIIGDKSEFQDSETIRLRNFEGEQINFSLNIPDLKKIPEMDRNDVFKKEIKKRISILTKEHYSWFEDGRNALLWDIESNIFKECTYPIGLISLNNFTWKQIVSEMLKGNVLPINLPNCVLYVIDDERNVLSVFKIREGIKGKEVLKFLDGKWTFRDIDTRIKALQIIFKKKLCDNNNDMTSKINRIAKIAIRIGEDPHKGGTIVFKKINKEEKLGTIGQPFKLGDIIEYDEEDLILLISQDGATYYDIDENYFQFRKLLTFHGINIGTLENLFKRYLDNLEESFTNVQNGKKDIDLWPLAFVGSRRWSSAITILQENVKGVLVISQDGDIFFWYKSSIEKEKIEDNNILNSIRAIEFKSTGEVYHFSMENNKITLCGNIFENDELIKILGGEVCQD